MPLAQTKQSLDVILNNDLLPTITRPTRITQTTASLIDNIFVTKPLHCNFDSLILLNDMSDHLPTLTLLKQTRIVDKDPIIFESHCLNNDKFGKIKHELYSIDWNGHLNSSDCNENFNVFCDILRDTMDKHTPLKKVRISSKHRFCEPWMTTGIEEASQKTSQLNKETLKLGVNNTIIEKYKNCRNTYNMLKHTARIQYYQNKAEEYQKNTKNYGN